MFGTHNPSRRGRYKVRTSLASSISGDSDYETSNPHHAQATSRSPPLDNLPRMADLRSIAEDIKATLSSAISNLQSEVRAMNSRVDEAEKTAQKHSRDLRRLHATTSSHTSTLLNMTRKMEDLDNRRRRHNLRVHGLPESFEPPVLEATVTAFFNTLLGRTPGAQISIERLHRALQPRSSYAAAPP